MLGDSCRYVYFREYGGKTGADWESTDSWNGSADDDALIKVPLLARGSEACRAMTWMSSVHIANKKAAATASVSES